MQSIEQVRARLAQRAKAGETALVGALGALAAGTCVWCALTVTSVPDPIRPVARAVPVAVPAPVVPAPPAPLAIPALPVELPTPVPPLVPLDDPGAADRGDGTASGLAANGIPATALRAYRDAEAVLAAEQPSCRLDWALVAALGRVESNHGRFGGAVLSTSGVSSPPIRGPRLDGRAFALVRDTDGGRLDGDPAYDRAVGPLQFLPGTWRVVGPDGNHDGIADPHNIFDAALGAGVYLCSGSTDLANPASLYAAVYRYNHSGAYVAQVLALAARYRTGGVVADPDPAPIPAPATTTPVPPTSLPPATVPPATEPVPTTLPPTTVPPTTTIPTTTESPTPTTSEPTGLLDPLLSLLPSLR